MSVHLKPARRLIKLCLALAALALAAIACQPTFIPTSVPTTASPPSNPSTPALKLLVSPIPTFTTSPTFTADQPPHQTPTGVASPTSLPSPNPGQTTWVGIGGYSFQAIPGYLVEINVSQATISDPAGHILISMTGAVPSEPLPMDRLLADFLDNLASNLTPFQASAPYPLLLAGIEGLAVDISGVMFNEPFNGRVAVAIPAGTNQFSILAIGMQSGGRDYWALQGQQTFEAVMASLRFFAPTDSACPVSSDPAYGYTPGSPIQVGGGALTASARELAYLASLRGPNFEALETQRLSAQPYGETTLESFSISYPGLEQPVKLYLDPNHYQAPQAPLGLKCPQPFDLPPP